MTHDPREALERLHEFATSKINDLSQLLSIPPKNSAIWDLRNEIAKEIEALTASPGEQKPVAHRIRVVDGSYCKVIPDGELEIWKQNWSTHLKSGHALLEPLYLSPPPAAGWNEAIDAADDLYASLVDCEPKNNQQREAVEAYAKAQNAMTALRREAPAPEGVSDGYRYKYKPEGDWFWQETYPSDTSGMCAIEAVTRPDAGGGVREALVELTCRSQAARDYIGSWPVRRMTDSIEQKIITKDLIRKVSDDVGNAIRRVLAIAPEPHLPVAMAAGASAIAPLALLLDTDPKPTPDPDCLLLAGLLLARTTSSNAVEEAFKDFEILKAAGRSSEDARKKGE